VDSSFASVILLRARFGEGGEECFGTHESGGRGVIAGMIQLSGRGVGMERGY